MTYHIKRNHEHFDVYINGKFYCTADSEKEAAQEIEKYINERNGSDENQSAC